MGQDQQIHEFTISTEELKFVRQLGSHDETLASLLKSVEAGRGGKFRLRLERFQAEQVRASLTELLAQAGFEEDYSPTKPGRILEELIDRFYIP